MFGKTFYIQTAQALTPAFRFAKFWNSRDLDAPISGTSALSPTNSLNGRRAFNESAATISIQSSCNSSSQSIPSIKVIAPFTSGTITADIIQRIKEDLRCHLSVIFDPTELEDEDSSNAWSWHSSDCLLIMGHEQSVTSKSFESIQNYLKKGGRVVYWGNIAPDEGTQFELIGARRKNYLSNDFAPIAFPVDSLQLVNNMREFYPIGKIPRFTYLPSDCQVLLYGKNDSTITPLAWTRNVGNGKLFYCGLAEESDWLGDDCLTLMLNAIRWGCIND